MISPIEVIAAAERAIAFNDRLAPLLAFAAGVVSSVGPCMVARYVALAALVGNSRSPILTTVAFLAGLIGTYATFGVVASFLPAVFANSSLIYGILAAGSLFAAGQLLFAKPHQHDHHQQDEGASKRLGFSSPSAALLAGGSCALVISPCCTPLVTTIILIGSNSGALHSAYLLAVFGLGHALPLIFVGGFGSVLRRMFSAIANSPIPQVFSAGLLVALGAYYALLV